MSSSLTQPYSNTLLPFFFRKKIQAVEGAFNQMSYELVFNPVREEDYGDYSCQIKNAEGTSIGNIRLERKFVTACLLNICEINSIPRAHVKIIYRPPTPLKNEEKKETEAEPALSRILRIDYCDAGPFWSAQMKLLHKCWSYIYYSV